MIKIHAYRDGQEGGDDMKRGPPNREKWKKMIGRESIFFNSVSTLNTWRRRMHSSGQLDVPCFDQLAKHKVVTLNTHDELIFYTIAECAVVLRVHRSSVSRMIRDGQLRHVRVGTRKLIQKSDLLRYIHNQIQ